MALQIEYHTTLVVWLLLALQIAAYEVADDFSVKTRSLATGLFNYTEQVDTTKYRRIVIAHAVLACLAWALLAPMGAIFLRSGIRGINLLKLHALWQLVVYAMYVTAAGLGLWMRLQLSSNGAVWRYPHASIGLVMLIGVFFQPWLGYIHHKIFKRRLDAINAGDTTKKLGRTIITQAHVWLGRLLITVGVINGGLGIMVTWDRGQSLQSIETSRIAAIGYGAAAGAFFLIYAALMFRHEHRRGPLIMDVAEVGSSIERSSTMSERSVQGIEIGRKWSVFVDGVPELTERERSRSRNRRGSSNEKLMTQVSGHSPTISPIEEVKTPS